MSAKRAFSILFLFLMVLNTIGYYSFLVVTREHLAQTITRKLESNAHEISGNMILKVPMALPYASDSEDYQPVRGEITYDGIVYQFIKQRQYRDTLYIVCLSDARSTEVKDKIIEYSKSFAGENNESGSDATVIVSLSKYFLFHSSLAQISQAGWSRKLSFYEPRHAVNESVSGCIFQPPEFLL
jgi:hypothetical protein